MRDLSGIYLWFDAEYTSLDLDRARLLQVALVMTDARLRRVAPPAEDLNLVVRLEPDAACDPWVRANMPALLDRCRSDAALTVADVDSRLAAQVDRILGPVPDDAGQRPVLAGNSVHHDWYLARRFLPSLIRRANYRLLDVTSWKLHWVHTRGGNPFESGKTDRSLVERYFPGEFTTGANEHDAHFDVLASIAEMNFYVLHAGGRGAAESAAAAGPGGGQG